MAYDSKRKCIRNTNSKHPYTQEIQNNPKASPEDVLEVTSILLKMSAQKENKYVDVDNIYVKKAEKEQAKGK